MSALACATTLCGCSAGPSTAPTASTHQVANTGCAKDIDCLGGRICNEARQCIEPPADSAAWEPNAAEKMGVGTPVNGAPAYAMFRANSKHNGRYKGAAPKKTPKLLWSVDLKKNISASPTIGPDGTIYVTSHAHTLTAIDPKGSVKWTFKTGDRIWSTTALSVDG